MPRIFFLLLFGCVDLSPIVMRSLRFVPPAALAAILLPALLAKQGERIVDPANPRLLATAVAAIVALANQKYSLYDLCRYGSFVAFELSVGVT